jgi:orotidine-5'-phosphate decarboxylase
LLSYKLKRKFIMVMPPVSPVSPAASKLFLALDTSSLQVAIDLVDKTSRLGIGYKIGLELIHAGHGPTMVRYIRQKDCSNDLFYDAKLDDTPNTMMGAAQNIANLSVEYFNVHATAGPDSVEPAASVKGDAKLLAVTLLTTITPEQFYSMLVSPFEGGHYSTVDPDVAKAGLARVVVALAKMAKQKGADGIVCSALELPMLMADSETAPLIKMVPGTRMPGADAHEQKRVGTPMKAIEDGGWEHTFLVIGREATDKPDPAAVLIRIMEAILPFAPKV